MKLIIDIHPDMMNSPKEIGELVVKQMIREAEGKPRVTKEESTKFVEGIGIVGKVEQWETNKNFSNKEKFIEIISGKKLYGQN